jgi:putative transposase
MSGLKKNLSYLSIDDKRQIIREDNNNKISLRRKCNLLDLHKANLYYAPAHVSIQKLLLLNKIDEIYTEHPYFGTRRMVQELYDYGYYVGRDLVRSCYEILGLEAIYPKINLSKRNFEHKIYPYLLRNVAIIQVNQVWSADITYIRMAHGFVYLVAIIDWYSRYILSWRLSNTLHYNFCVEALQDALQDYGNPKIFNTDQGCQFTANAWIDELLHRSISISMDGRGRALDNVFIERFWRSLKQEKIYLMDLHSVKQAQDAITDYVKFYNTKRKHQSLDYLVPETVYQQGLLI